MKIVISDRAKLDITQALLWSIENFGEEAMNRYKALIAQALSEIEESPNLQGSRSFEHDILLYHLRFSKKRAMVDRQYVKKPRHFVVYRAESKCVEVLRILHDGMDISDQLE